MGLHHKKWMYRSLNINLPALIISLKDVQMELLFLPVGL